MRNEFDKLIRPIYARARQRGIKAFPITIVGIAISTVVTLIVRTPWGHQHLYNALSERIALPWHVAIVHLIPSLFVPAFHLPLWGTIAQIAFCCAAAETYLGAKLTLSVGLAAHFVATLSGRFFVWLGPKLLFGLPAWLAHVHDNGPSAVTLSLATYMAFKIHSRALAAAVIVVLIADSFLNEPLTRREHFVSVIFAAVAYGIVTAIKSWRHEKPKLIAEGTS